LKSLLASVEADVEGLEEGKVIAESRLLLDGDGVDDGFTDGVGLEEKLVKLDADLDHVMPRAEREDEEGGGLRAVPPLQLHVAGLGGGKGDLAKGQLTMDELLDKMAAVQSQLAESNKENLVLKQQAER